MSQSSKTPPQYQGYRITSGGCPIHTEEDCVKMRAAGKLAKSVLDYIEEYVVPGVSTERLNQLCHDYIIKNGAIPAPLNYKGFPKSICTSVNHVVCHGIPSEDHILKSGDIVNVDITVILDGYHGDTSRMFIVGKGTTLANRLCEATHLALMRGIEQVKPGNTLRHIAIAIEEVVAQYGYSLVRDFCGHGIGKIFHMDPQVVHYNNTQGDYQDLVLEPGMFFTIEPMVNVGTWKVIVSKFDGWTATTRDKKLSAQYEHSLGVTNAGFEIFTK